MKIKSCLLAFILVLILSTPLFAYERFGEVRDVGSNGTLLYTIERFDSDGLLYHLYSSPDSLEPVTCYVSALDSIMQDRVIIPGHIEHDGKEYAVEILDVGFENCQGLLSVEILEGCSQVGYCAFRGCTSLSEVKLPSSMHFITRFSFEGCVSLRSITLPVGVLLGGTVFKSCYSLESINLENVDYKYNSFENCYSLKKVIFDEKPIDVLPSMMFKNCISLSEIDIPNCKSIGSEAFEGCTGLRSVTIPDGVQKIGERAFEGCEHLTSIYIPSSVQFVASDAFNGCINLDTIIVAEDNPWFESSDENNAIIETSTKTLVRGSRSVKNLQGIEEIGDYAFYGCKIEEMEIPDGVTSIGRYAFEECTELRKVIIPVSVTSIGDSVHEDVFGDCRLLSSIVVELGNKIYDSRKSCNAIIKTSENRLISGSSSTIIPNGVTEIAPWSFWGRSNLSSIVIPRTVKLISSGAFADCSGLQEIKVNRRNPVYDSRKNSNAIIISSSKTLHTGCCRTTIPSEITSIGKYAFYGMNGMASMIIPENIESIKYYAFYKCSGLKELTLSDNVSFIGEGAFERCSGLTSFNIPAGIDTLYSSLFYGCTALKNVVIPQGVVQIRDAVFQKCTALETIIIPKSVTTIGDGSFLDCSSLRYVNIQNPEAGIGSVVFEDHANVVDAKDYNKEKKPAIPMSNHGTKWPVSRSVIYVPE
jgi:hypothetical protein